MFTNPDKLGNVIESLRISILRDNQNIIFENDLLYLLGKLVYGILSPLHLQQQSKKNNEFV